MYSDPSSPTVTAAHLQKKFERLRQALILVNASLPSHLSNRLPLQPSFPSIVISLSVYFMNEHSQLPFFLVEDSDLRKLLGANTSICRKFPPISFGNIIARCTMIELRKSRKRTSIPGSAPFPIELLPPEIVYQIFEQVHPIDLYNLARTSRAIRGLLLNPYGETIWKTALARHPEIISNPPDLLERKWIIFLYGSDTCETCGRNETDFCCVFRQRLCKECQDNQYVPSVGHVLDSTILAQIVKNLIPADIDDDFDDLVVERYRRSDITHMVNKLKEFQSAVDAQKPGSRIIYDEFLVSESARALAVEEDSKMYLDWAWYIRKILDKQRGLQYDRITDLCIRKLSSLDYDVRDLFSAKTKINNFIQTNHFLRTPRHNWITIQPKLEIFVKEEVSIRMQNERIDHVFSLYEQYRKRRPADTWNHAPFWRDIIPIFDQYVHSSDSRPESLHLDVANKVFDDEFEHWRKKRQRKLAKLIDSRYKSLSETDIAKVLDLATSVFIFTAFPTQSEIFPIQFGWKDAGGHEFAEFLRAPFTFSRIGYEAASSIVRLLGLDPELTTASELDKLDARFFCETCPVMLDGRNQVRKAFTWRECVIHAIDKETIESHWALLTTEAAALIRTHEPPILPPDELSWSCSHCAVHYKNFTLRKDAMEHVRDSHSILDPVPGKDVVFLDRYIRRSALSLSRDTEYVCKHCLPSQKRLKRLRDLRLHLPDKHGVRQPVENEDWVHVKVIEKTWPTQA